MFRIPQFFCRSFINRIVIPGVLAVFIAPCSALADPPADPKEQSVPVQLTLIRDYLADMDSRLNERLDDLSGQIGANNDLLLGIQGVTDAILYDVTSVKLEMKTNLCIDEGIMATLEGGGHGEFGVGWPNVLDAKATLQGDAGFGVEVAVGYDICVEIPLYSVVANDFLVNLQDYADFDTKEFDLMLSTIAGGAQWVVPVWADIYGELMPTPKQAIEVLDNYYGAIMGENLKGGSPTYGPEYLLAPDIMLDPAVPPIIDEFIKLIPETVEFWVENPCTGLEMSPLGKIIDKTDPLYSWLCNTTSNGLQLAVDGITLVVNAIKTIVNPVRKFLGLPEI
jgi:hypothetical protein